MGKPLDVDEAWTIRTSTAPERIAEQTAALLNQHKCVVSRTSPTVVTASFSYRPVPWLALAIVLVPVTLFLSLLLLLVRSTATVSAVVESRPGSRVIRLAGAAPEVVLSGLRAAYQSAGAVEGDHGRAWSADLRIAPIPGSATSPSPEVSEPSSPHAAHAAAPLVMADPSVSSQGDGHDDAAGTRRRTPLPSGPAAEPDPATSRRAAAPMLAVDTASGAVPWPEFGLLGRDPKAGRGDPETTVTIAVDDPDRVVSKTHAAIGRDQHGLWVMDRQSTNGTSLINPDGQERPLTPGARTPVDPGDTIVLGGERQVQPVAASLPSRTDVV